MVLHLMDERSVTLAIAFLKRDFETLKQWTAKYCQREEFLCSSLNISTDVEELPFHLQAQYKE